MTAPTSDSGPTAVDGTRLAAARRAGSSPRPTRRASSSTRPAATPAALEALVERRLAGEPLAWITGWAAFGDVTVAGRPRASTSPAGRASSWPGARRPGSPTTGTAVDLCTGSGAIALALRRARPRRASSPPTSTRGAVACAGANGVEAYAGDLFAAVPPSLGARDRRGRGRRALRPHRRAPPPPARHARLRGRRRTTTGGATAPTCCPARRRGPRVLCARAARCCSSSAATRPSSCARSWTARATTVRSRRGADEDGDLRGLAATRPAPA